MEWMKMIGIMWRNWIESNYSLNVRKLASKEQTSSIWIPFVDITLTINSIFESTFLIGHHIALFILKAVVVIQIEINQAME